MEFQSHLATSPPIQLDDFAHFLSDTIDHSSLHAAMNSAELLQVSMQQVLFSQALITPNEYAKALAAHHRVRALAAPDLASVEHVLIDATGQPPDDVALDIARARSLQREPVLFVGSRERNITPRETLAHATVHHAIESIRRKRPSLSAGRRMWLWQYFFCALTLGSLLGTAIAAPAIAGELILHLCAITFAGVVLFRLLVLSAALTSRSKATQTSGTSPRLGDEHLPTYSLLVPLYREASILPDLIEALSEIDYPRPKLDIVLILEESDTATRAAAARAVMPAYMRTIVVPDRQPRTKPKALNMALPFTRGQYIAIYDAEDVPQPDQLRKAAAIFAANPGRYACLQASLAIYNPKQSWLTRHFTLEYATLFHAFLPALARLRLPIPLSGTSNHFPRDVAEKLTWDPFNVTEDADLGIRLTRRGGRIGLLDCETQEEAPPTWRQWLPQRTRWIKGWMQTYLVHTRRPWRLMREMGLWRTAGFHALFGGFLLSVLAYPLLFLLAGIELTRLEPFVATAGSAHHVALIVALLDLALGVTAALIMMLVGARRAGTLSLGWHIPFAPVYWLLVSLAGYRALFQFVWRPHLWEKTEHAARFGKRRHQPLESR